MIGLPEPLVALLVEHREDQERERVAARQLWQDGGWVFATEVGRPINPNTDYHAWKRLLKPPAYGRAGSTTPGTPRPPFSWSSASPNAP